MPLQSSERTPKGPRAEHRATTQLGDKAAPRPHRGPSPEGQSWSHVAGSLRSLAQQPWAPLRAPPRPLTLPCTVAREASLHSLMPAQPLWSLSLAKLCGGMLGLDSSHSSPVTRQRCSSPAQRHCSGTPFPRLLMDSEHPPARFYAACTWYVRDGLFFD